MKCIIYQQADVIMRVEKEKHFSYFLCYRKQLFLSFCMNYNFEYTSIKEAILCATVLLHKLA